MPDRTHMTCPVCGRQTGLADRCSFCGSSIAEALAQASGDKAERPIAAHGGQDVPADPPSWHPPPPGHEYGQQPQYTGGVPPGPLQAPRYAGFWIRAVAYSIDSILVQVAAVAIMLVGRLGYTAGAGGHSSLFEFASWLMETGYNLVASVVIAINLVYFTFFLARSGQTPGKRLCGLKVIGPRGEALTVGRALSRTVCLLVTLCVFPPATLWVAIDRRKQGLHDKIASTFEIRADP